MKIKSPFNWVGNKYRYIDQINNLLIGKSYSTVYDVFMGSGNIMLNIDCSANLLIGNDYTPLMPNIYKHLSGAEGSFLFEELNQIIDSWNRFSDKEDYYRFRDHWNNKYLAFNYDKEFIYETILLLKMCSNSMVRFNYKKGYFNQGFRGISEDKIANNNGEFFTERMKKSIIKELNSLKKALQSRNFDFTVGDFRKVLCNVTENDLVILDPPYTLGSEMYGGSFTDKEDLYLLNFIEESDCDFILFNYLKKGDTYNLNLKKFLDSNPSLYVESLNTKLSAGQNRLGRISIEEIMISNIKSN